MDIARSITIGHNYTRATVWHWYGRTTLGCVGAESKGSYHRCLRVNMFEWRVYVCVTLTLQLFNLQKNKKKRNMAIRKTAKYLFRWRRNTIVRDIRWFPGSVSGRFCLKYSENRIEAYQNGCDECKLFIFEYRRLCLCEDQKKKKTSKQNTNIETLNDTNNEKSIIAWFAWTNDEDECIFNANI